MPDLNDDRFYTLHRYVDRNGRWHGGVSRWAGLMKTSVMLKKFCVFFLCFMSVHVSAEECGVLEKQADMNRCYAAEYKAVDKVLNDVYTTYRNTLSEGRQKSLIDAQRAWIKYRDLSCDFETDNSKGGSMFQMVLSMCRAEKTRARIEEIKRLGVCAEGDVSC